MFEYTGPSARAAIAMASSQSVPLQKSPRSARVPRTRCGRPAGQCGQLAVSGAGASPGVVSAALPAEALTVAVTSAATVVRSGSSGPSSASSTGVDSCAAKALMSLATSGAGGGDDHDELGGRVRVERDHRLPGRAAGHVEGQVSAPDAEAVADADTRRV